MRNKKLTLLFAMASAAMVATAAPAATIDLQEWGINIDGTITHGDITGADTLPGTVNSAAFDFSTGLGTLQIKLTDAGSHSVILFVDHEIDQEGNTFFNEYGAVAGTLEPGQSWEIDEPGWTFGDIYDNFLASGLDNTNGVPSTAPEDVSMAMAWNFTLAAGDIGTVSFILSTIQPTSGFYLAQTDPDSNNATVYFQSTFEQQQPPCSNCIPEPGTILLTLTGLAGLAGLRRQRGVDC